MRRACVVGSGPSGATCAFSLVRAGIDVTMLDVGFQLEESRRDLTHNTGEIDAKVFLKRVRRHRKLIAKTSFIPAKMPFGSDYAYRQTQASRLQIDKGTTLVCSLALGGLSNAWGANVCLLAAHDMVGWPFRQADFAPYFKDLERLVDVAGSTDDAVNELYDPPLKQSETYPLGPQGQFVISRVHENAETLKSSGLYCGRAQLAIGKRYATNGEGCVSCGLCMHGCPYNAIFSSTEIVERLKRESSFHYLPGRFVKKFQERNDQVSVFLEDLASGEPGHMQFDRLYLACGAIGTTVIVARSLDLCGHIFEIKDSTKYLFPFMLEQRLHGAMAAPANTLAQVFVQSVDQQSTSRTVHGQLYGYNDLVLEPMKKLLGDAVFSLAPLGAFLLERLMIGMVYLHSDDSGCLKLQVAPEGAGKGLGKVWGEPTPRSDVVLNEFMDKLDSARRELGGHPLRKLVNKNKPGLSQHFGSSLPMKQEPDRWSTDLCGRPWTCTRTHCVDSSVLPSIPGTPTALLLMANALRIVDKSREL